MYYRETIEATKKAITKWEKICYEGGSDKICSLCDLFAYMEEDPDTGDEICPGCPIYDFTGHDCMDLSEYRNWWNLTNGFKDRRVLDSFTYEAAKAELEFITRIFTKTLLFWDLKEEFRDCPRKETT